MASAPVGFDWTDPLLLEQQLTDDERMVMASARDYSQDKLMSRVLMANREERFDREIMNEFGALGTVSYTHLTLPTKADV